MVQPVQFRTFFGFLLLGVTLLLLAPVGANAGSPFAITMTGKDVIESPPPASRYYGGIEYLLWWVKGAPLSVPLVSSGPSSEGADGAILSAPNAVVLYGASYGSLSGGNDTQNFGSFSGARVTLGGWLEDQQLFGIEVSGFLLETQTAGYEIRSDGSTVLNIPVYGNVPYMPGGGISDMGAKGEDGLPLAIPGALSGGVKITNSVQLWGADLTGVMNLYRDSSWKLSALAGFRYLDLYEKFHLSADLKGIGSSDEGMSYLGQSGNVYDRFQTRNQFYGANLGLRGTYSRGPLSVEFTGMVALGVSHQNLNVAGWFDAVNSSFGAFGTEGIFAQPANEGRTTGNRFTAVPEGKIKLGYALTSYLTVTVSYDILYLSSVVRPGDQLNRTLPKGQVFNQGLATPSTTSPSKRFESTDFYAQGVSFGMEFTF